MSELKSLTIARNTLPSCNNPSVAAIQVENVGDVSISGNSLGPTETSSHNRGCLVPQLINVTASNAESFGTGCRTGVNIPLPRCGTSGCDASALEITAWTSTGALVKTIVMAGGQMAPVANSSTGAEAVSIVVLGQNRTATLRTASGASLSFRATPL